MFEIRVIVRTAHIVAAAVWVGGSMLYLVAVLPALRNGGSAPGVSAQIAALFRRMVNICMGVLLLSGAYLTFDRLTSTALGWPYLVVLGLKIIAALGILVILLGALLNGLFEATIAPT